MPTAWIDGLVALLQSLSPFPMWQQELVVRGSLALLCIGLTCGSVGSLVVGGRMAFFSDALAHCAFAGVGLGLLLGFLTGTDPHFLAHSFLAIMVGFGILMGLSIAFVRDRTAQANDTVIGVFFAGAIGLGAIFLKAGTTRRYFPPEDFLFGNLVTIQNEDLLALLVLTVATGVVLVFLYNGLVFASFSPSLARSRGFRVRLLSYLFIILLALIVNICLKAVGVLLINGLLIVPSAAAANLCRNMRQLFAVSMLTCVGCGLLGQAVSWEVQQRTPLDPGESGTIVVLAVLLYFISIPVGAVLKDRRAARAAAVG